jgi:hypothetical protein
MLQLNPMLPLVHEDGRKFTAFAMLDYSQEHELMFAGWFEESREIWVLPQTKLRAGSNLTLGR